MIKLQRAVVFKLTGFNFDTKQKFAALWNEYSRASIYNELEVNDE